MSSMSIGSLWVSRLNGDLRILTEIADMGDDSEAFMVSYHDVTRGYTATTSGNCLAYDAQTAMLFFQRIRV